MRRAADISSGDIAAGGGETHAAVDLGGVNTASAGGDIDARIFGNVQVQRHPEASGLVALRPFRFQEHTFGGVARRNSETLQKLLGVFLRSIRFEMDAIVYLVGISGILGVNRDAAEVRLDADAVTFMGGDGSAEIRGEARIGTTAAGRSSLAMRRSAADKEKARRKRQGEDGAERLSEIRSWRSSRHV